MSEFLIKTHPNLAMVFTSFGAIFLILLAAILFANLYAWIKEAIKHFIYIYRYKHRFGKPPLAKCYCKDCTNWNKHKNSTDKGTCYAHGNWTTADCWFCWDADPCSYEYVRRVATNREESE